MEDLRSLEYFTDPAHIVDEYKDEISALLNRDAAKLNFKHPQTLANVFALLYEARFLYEFIEHRKQTIRQAISMGEISRLSQRKEYSKHNTMVDLARAKNSLWYKFQLDNHDISDFVTYRGKQPHNLFKYLVPNVDRKYRHDIAKHAMLGHQNPNYNERMKWLAQNFDKVIVPMLQGAEGLHEYSDGQQLQTSRIVRLPVGSDNDNTFGWLLIHFSPDQEIHKKHIYKSDLLRIEFYAHRGDIVQVLMRQQQSLNTQIKRLTKLYDLYNTHTPEQIEELYHDGHHHVIAALVQQAKDQATGYTTIEATIQSTSGVNNNAYTSAKHIKSIQKKLQEQIHKARIVQEKNILHIESLNKYVM